MKIITLCGSLKFQKEMMIVAEEMALEGNCILTPVYSTIENLKRTEEQLKKLKVELKEFSTMAKMSSWMGIKMEMLKDNSDARIADMLIKGLTVGTMDMNKKIDNYEKIVDKDILKFAKEFKSFQEDSIEKLKVYL